MDQDDSAGNQNRPEGVQPRQRGFVEIRIQTGEDQRRQIAGQRVRKTALAENGLFRVRKARAHLLDAGIAEISCRGSRVQNDLFLRLHVCRGKSRECVEQIKGAVREQAVDLGGERSLIDAQFRDRSGKLPVLDLLRQKPQVGKPQIHHFPKRFQCADRPLIAQLSQLAFHGTRRVRVQNGEPDQIRQVIRDLLRADDRYSSGKRALLPGIVVGEGQKFAAGGEPSGSHLSALSASK